MTLSNSFRIVGACSSLAAALSLPLTAQSNWAAGDLIVGVGNGQYKVYDSGGALKETIQDVFGGIVGGLAWSPAGDLYTTSFTGGAIVVRSAIPPHATVSTISTTSLGGSHPTSVVFDASGNFYVGHADGDRDIKKFTLTGAYAGTFNAATENRGSNWLELAADQRTMFYTSEGRRIMRYDVVTGAQLSDFALLPGFDEAYAVRLLPPYDGSGGALVAYTAKILRLNASGNVVQTYDLLGQNFWFSLRLDPNASSFWAGNLLTTRLYRFNLASGAVEFGPLVVGGDAASSPAEVLVLSDTPPACVVYVDRANNSGTENGSFQFPYNTVVEGVQNVCAGGRIVVKAGNYTARASPATDDEMPAAHEARQAAAAALRPRELPGSRIFARREDSRT